MNYDSDLDELDRIWPLGKKLVVPDGGTVLVAGAYEGRYMDYVATRFKPATVIGYEPQPDKAAIAEERLRSRHDRETFHVYDKALGIHDCFVSLTDRGTDGCQVSQSMLDDPRENIVGMIGIESVLDMYPQIDLFICNMEGYEIPLLSYLWAAAMLPEITSLAVQFHSPNLILPSMLTKLYGQPVYNDFPTWTYWKQ